MVVSFAGSTGVGGVTFGNCGALMMLLVGLESGVVSAAGLLPVVDGVVDALGIVVVFGAAVAALTFFLTSGDECECRCLR